MDSSRNSDAAGGTGGDIWRALAHPCRRAILDRLHEGPATTTEVVEAVGETRFVVMQHLGVLRAADLVHTVADGRRRINHLNPVPLQRIYERWVSKYEGAWAAALTGLAATLEAEPAAEQPAPKPSRTPAAQGGAPASKAAASKPPNPRSPRSKTIAAKNRPKERNVG